MPPDIIISNPAIIIIISIKGKIKLRAKNIIPHMNPIINPTAGKNISNL